MGEAGVTIDANTKQLARFERVGHDINGDHRQVCSRGVGYEKDHVVINGATRMAYAEVLSKEQKATTVSLLARAVEMLSQQGMTCRLAFSANGSAYRSGEWYKA